MTSLSANPARTASYATRISRVKAAMNHHEINRLIAYGWGAHSYLDFNPAWYLSGYKQLGRSCVVVIEADGDSWMAVEPAWEHDRALRWSTIDVIASDDALDLVRRRAKDRTWGQARNAVASGRDSWMRDLERWQPIIGAIPVDGTELVTSVARTRDEWSIALITEAVSIAEASYQHGLDVARPGLPEHQLHAAVDLHGRELGADDNFLLMSASQHNFCVHQPTDRLLEVGDIVLAEITPSVQGEFVQICRTFVVGREPSEVEKEKFDLLTDAFEAGRASARPGAAVGEVVAALNKPIVEAGYAEYTRPPYMRIRGHANGLGPPVPQLSPRSTTVLEEAMTFELHPNQYLPETGYMMCGEPVIVTATGCDLLTSQRGTLDRC